MVLWQLNSASSTVIVGKQSLIRRIECEIPFLNTDKGEIFLRLVIVVNIAYNYKLCGFNNYLKSKLDLSISPVNHAVSLVKYEGRRRYDSLVLESNLRFVLFKPCSVQIFLNSNHPWCYISLFRVTEKNYPTSDCHWNRNLCQKVWFNSYLVPPSLYWS